MLELDANGFVAVIDRAFSQDEKGKDVAGEIKMFPIDVRANITNGGNLKDGRPRFVLKSAMQDVSEPEAA